MVRWGDRRHGLIAVAMLLAAVCAAPAQGADDPLELVQKAMKAGKADLALRALNTALSGGLLKGADIAKAYYLRGLANAKAGNQTAAVSDLNNALWLKGLSEAERKDALAAKTAAFEKAGVPVKAAEAAATPTTVKKPEPEAIVVNAPLPLPLPPPAVAPAPAPMPVKVAATPVPAPVVDEPENAVPQVISVPAAIESQTAEAVPDPAPLPATNNKKPRVAAHKWAAVETTASAAPESLPWQTKAAPAATMAPSAEPTATLAAAPPDSAPASDINPLNTLLSGLFGLGQPAAAAATPDQPVAPAVKMASAEAAAQIYLQVASLRTTGEAEAFSAKLTADHAGALAGMEPRVTPTVIGNMGTFYAVLLGPVASKLAGASLCAKLRQEGVDCYFATP